MKTVNIDAAKTRLSQLVEQAAAGEEIGIRIGRNFDAPLPPDIAEAFGAE